MPRGGSFLSPQSQFEFSLSLWTKEEKTKRQGSVIRAYRGVGGRGCERRAMWRKRRKGRGKGRRKRKPQWPGEERRRAECLEFAASSDEAFEESQGQ